MTVTDAPPEKKSQRDFEREQVTGAIAQICDAWARRPKLQQIARTPGGSQGGPSGSHGDPTANPRSWITQPSPMIGLGAKSTLVLVLRFSPNESAQRWRGSFNPVRLKVAIQDGAAAEYRDYATQTRTQVVQPDL